jgi:hypothetical protein
MRNHVLSVRESLVRRRGGGPMFGAAWMVLYAALSAACVLLPDPDPSRRDATIDDGARSDEGIDVEVGRDASDADVPSDDGDAPPDRECAAPWIRCGGECVDPRTSAAHCGGCSQACARANAASACVNGSCILGACLAGFGDCDGRPDNGCETDVRASAAHCGRCGVMCALPNAVAACRGGACGLGSCVGGYADCDGIADTGCEVDTRNRLDHCGGCRRACTADAGAMAVCRGGVCEATACSPPMLDCVAPGSCTTDVRSHLMHCGRCGNACGGANATPACDAGACDLSCAPGWGNCDGNDATGCETHLQSSGAHCGMCGRRCAADQNCMGGACVCPTGLTTCPGTSCVNLATDRSHCGSCGNACALPNTAANCVMGVCTVGICSANFADCNGSRMDGCEVNVQAEVSHCGGCGRPCAPPNATARCVGGVCTITGCAAGLRRLRRDDRQRLRGRHALVRLALRRLRQRLRAGDQRRRGGRLRRRHVRRGRGCSPGCSTPA